MTYLIICLLALIGIFTLLMLLEEPGVKPAAEQPQLSPIDYDQEREWLFYCLRRKAAFTAHVSELELSSRFAGGRYRLVIYDTIVLNKNTSGIEQIHAARYYVTSDTSERVRDLLVAGQCMVFELLEALEAEEQVEARRRKLRALAA